MQEERTITKTLQERRTEFADKPVSEKEYTIRGKQYRVVSHFVGEKDIDKVIGALAEKRAYDDAHNSIA